MYTNNHLKRLYQFCENIHKFFYLFFFFCYCQFIFLFYTLYCATKQSIDYEYYIAKSIETNMNYVFVGQPPVYGEEKLSRLYRPKTDPKIKIEIKHF